MRVKGQLARMYLHVRYDRSDAKLLLLIARQHESLRVHHRADTRLQVEADTEAFQKVLPHHDREDLVRARAGRVVRTVRAGHARSGRVLGHTMSDAKMPNA